MADDISEKIDKLAKEVKKMSKTSTTSARDPIKDMKDAGFGAFTAEGQKALNIINIRYTGDFLTFFIELEKKYSGYTRQTAEITRIKSVRQKIGDLSVLIDKLLLGTISSDPSKDIQNIRQSVNDLDSEFEFFTNSAKVTNVLSENMKEVEGSTGISIDDLKYAQGLFGRKTQQLAKRSRISPELKDFGKGMLKGVAISALAPFAPFISPATKMFQGNRRRAETVESSAFENAGINREESVPRPTSERTPEFASMGTSVGEEQVGGRRRAAAGGGGGRPGSHSTQDELFLFFNTKASQAKWTKELLEAVGGGTAEKDPTKKAGGFEMSGIAGMLGNLGKAILPALGPILGVTASAVGGWMAGRWLGEHIKWGGKSLDKHVQDGFVKLMGGDEKDRLKKASREATRPEMKRALELVAGGMNPREAALQASSELGITPGKGAETKKQIGKTGLVSTIGVGEQGEMEKKSAYETDVKKYLPGGTAGMSVGEISKAVKTGRETEAKERDADKRMGIDNAVEGKWADGRKEKVPIDTAQAELAKTQKDSAEKLHTAVTTMSEAMTGAGKTGTKGKQSGHDANNTRNPVLSSIGAGQITD